MKIGPHIISGTDEDQANSIINDFYSDINLETGESGDPRIEEGDLYGTGRSVQDDKQYRLAISNKTYSGIKLRYDQQTHFEFELIVQDIRQKLDMLGYKVKVIDGFPIDGDKWRKDKCLISYWGPQGQRTDLETLTPSQILSSDRTIFLEEIGSNSAFTYALGLWDRNNKNFVWDIKEKKLISIDHEQISKEEIDQLLTQGISTVVTKFFDANWFEDKELRTLFTNAFGSTWYNVAKNRDKIADIYEQYGFKNRAHYLKKRIDKGPSIPLGLIMMP